MKCSACKRPSGRLVYVERHKHSGFGYRTVRSFLCPACDPANRPPVPTDGAELVGRELSEGRS